MQKFGKHTCFYKCEICGELVEILTHTHLEKHNISMNEYLEKYKNTDVKDFIINNYRVNYKLKNKDKTKEYNKIYRIKNKDKIREYNKYYWIKNKEKMEYKNRLNVKIWIKKNKDKKNKYNKKWREENKEKIKEYNQIYYNKSKNVLHCMTFYDNVYL